MKNLFIALMLCLFASCQETAKPISEQVIGKWKVTLLDELKINEDSKTFLEFKEGGKVGGNNGCNNFFGTYELKGTVIKFSLMGATKMLCHGESDMIEMNFSKSLGDATEIEFKDDMIILKSEGHLIHAKRFK